MCIIDLYDKKNNNLVGQNQALTFLLWNPNLNTKEMFQVIWRR